MEVQSSDLKRQCYACGSKQTYYHPKDYSHPRGYSHWYANGNTGLFLCKRCYDRYFTNPKWHPITNARLFSFKGQMLQASEGNGRIGVCNICRAVKPFDCQRTVLHHVKYDSKRPLAYTIELCPRCHYREHPRKLKNYKSY